MAAARLLAAAAAVAGAAAGPVFMFGPTAAHKDMADEITTLVSDEALSEWSELRTFSNLSGGALHLRQAVFGSMRSTPGQQEAFGQRTTKLGLRVSIEAGGALCGDGSGARGIQKLLTKIDAFLGAGGKLAFWGLESVFSRTYGSCPDQPLNVTVAELADYAGGIASAMPETRIFLYDALPHYHVGSEYPPSVPKYPMELGNVLTLLAPAMASKGATLQGYWADCPYESSASTLPNGKYGFDKLAAAVKVVKDMGLQFGKTFNSLGGKTSDKDFYNGTLADVSGAMAVIPSNKSGGYSLDLAMVETWYTYPTSILPEGQPYTTAYTARAGCAALHVCPH